MVLVRQEIGDVLRDFRLQKGRTLRQVASKASVALGYLSEVERGQKEASSEILASVADALDTPISVIMHEVGDRIAVLEGLQRGARQPARRARRRVRRRHDGPLTRRVTFERRPVLGPANVRGADEAAASSRSRSTTSSARAYGGVVVNDLVLATLGGRTAREALAAGVPAARGVAGAVRGDGCPGGAPARCRSRPVPGERGHGIR